MPIWQSVLIKSNAMVTNTLIIEADKRIGTVHHTIAAHRANKDCRIN
jgi:hypothetical protein